MNRVTTSVLLIALLLAGPVKAESHFSTAFRADRLLPPPGGVGLVALEDTRVRGHLRWHLHLSATTADAVVLLALQEGGGNAPVDSTVSHVTTAQVSAALELWRRLRVGLALPLHLLSGDRLHKLGQDRQFAPMSAGDLRLHVTWQIWANTRFAVGLAAGVGLPTGDDGNFAGTGGLSAMPRILLSGRPLTWLRLLGHWGVNLRSNDAEFFGTRFSQRMVTALGLELSLPWVPWARRHLRLLAEAEYETGDGEFDDPPVELCGGFRLLWRGWHVTLTGGGGLGVAVTTPAWRATLGVGVTLWQ